MSKKKRSYQRRVLSWILLIVVILLPYQSYLGATSVYGMEADQELDQDLSQVDNGLQEMIFDYEEVTDEGQVQSDIPRVCSQSSEWGRYSSNFYYNQMSDTEKTLYDRMRAQCERYMNSTNNMTKIYNGNYYMDDVSCEDLHMSVPEAQKIVQIFYQVESQYYYLKNRYLVTGSYSTQANSVSISVYNVFINGSTRDTYTNKFKEQILSWEKEVNSESSAYEKQKKINDLLCARLTYGSKSSSSNESYDQSAVSAVLNYGLFNRRTVCAGFAKAFQILCNGTGINACITISESHAWNFVNIEGTWYYVDTTFNQAYYRQNLKCPYLDISYTTLKKYDSYSNKTAHATKPDWAGYLPDCPVDYEKVTLSKESIALSTGQSETLKAALAGGLSGRIYWSSDNTGIATVDSNGKVTAKKAGAVKITARNSSLSASCTIIVRNFSAGKNNVVVEGNGDILYYKNGYVDNNFNGMSKASNGKRFWFDYGIAARDKEVYDPVSNAWYWFDADGTMATNKDAFIPTNKERTQGKWVRYDENGGMIKGEDFRYGGWYWFDPTTGEMIKGFVNIPDGTPGGKWVYYDDVTGQMHHGESCINGNWYRFDDVTGKMVHGEYCNSEGNWYYYDQITGIMAHGWATLPDGRTLYYDDNTGILR